MFVNAQTHTLQGFKESKVDEGTRQESLDHVGFLFAYIADKDIFHKYYSKLLSKRIIQLTSVSDEAEERMLKNMRKASTKTYYFQCAEGGISCVVVQRSCGSRPKNNFRGICGKQDGGIRCYVESEGGEGRVVARLRVRRARN